MSDTQVDLPGTRAAKRVDDPELVAMAKIVDALGALDSADQAARVIRWLEDRYGETVAPSEGD